MSIDWVKGFIQDNHLECYRCKGCNFRVRNDSNMFREMKEHICRETSNVNVENLIGKLNILMKNGDLDGVDIEEIHILKTPPYDVPGVRV